jgi:hypothetical protein
VVADENSKMKNSLAVRILFCHDPECNGFEDGNWGEYLFVFERALYRRARTRYEQVVPFKETGEREATYIGKCLVEGCLDEGDTTSWCRGDPPEHACQFHPDFLRYEDTTDYPFPTVPVE